MRCYAFHVEPPGEPWVMAEGPDETWMRDLPHHVWSMAVVLSEAEAELDPDFAPALAAWRVRDDSTYEAWCSVEDAEMALDDARAELIVEGTVEFASPLAFKPWQPSARSAVPMWRRLAHDFKDAAERDQHPRLV